MANHAPSPATTKGEAMRQQIALQTDNWRTSIRLGSDDAWRGILLARKHKDTMLAPGRLRAIVAALDPRALDLHLIIERGPGNNALSLVWWCNELAAPGDSEAVLARLIGVAGAPVRRDGDQRHWQWDTKGVRQELMVEGPQDFVGGRNPTAGLALRFSVVLPLAVTNATGFTMAALSATAPPLACAALPAALQAAVADELLVSLSCGGTWTQYYSLSLGFAVVAGEPAANLEARLLATLTTMGYREFKRGDRTITLQGSDHGFAYLDRGTRPVLSLRLQPQS